MDRQTDRWICGWRDGQTDGQTENEGDTANTKILFFGEQTFNKIMAKSLYRELLMEI